MVFLQTPYIIGIGDTFFSRFRYMFFCQPFRYPRWCKKQNINTVVGITTIITFIYIIYTELTIGRKLAYVSFTCQLQDAGQAYFQMVFYVLIPLLITIICIIAISRVLKKQRMRINNLTVLAGNANCETTGSYHQINPIKQLVKNGGKTIRLIVMVSGIFVASVFPSAIFRQTVAMNGITWHDIETRSVYWASMLMRLETTFACVLFATVNPLIYCYVEKVFYYELKAQFKIKTRQVDATIISV